MALHVAPAEDDTEQQENDRSICGSDAGISNRSSKARVSKVTKRLPMGTPLYHKDRLSTLA